MQKYAQKAEMYFLGRCAKLPNMLGAIGQFETEIRAERQWKTLKEIIQRRSSANERTAMAGDSYAKIESY